MKSPIALFDSGKGGLTVLQKIEEKLPFEDVIYFGDVKNMPYGNKTEEQVLKLTADGVSFLAKKNPKIIVLACHTASSAMIQQIEAHASPPVLSIVPLTIDFTIKKTTKQDHIAILATEQTIRSQIYQSQIPRTVFPTACPEFAPLIEQGNQEKELEKVAVKYLTPLKGKISHLLLACTHYGMIEPLIQNIMGPKVVILNPAESVALWLFNHLEKKEESLPGIYHFFPDQFRNAFTLLKKNLQK